MCLCVLCCDFLRQIRETMRTLRVIQDPVKDILPSLAYHNCVVIEIEWLAISSTFNSSKIVEYCHLMRNNSVFISFLYKFFTILCLVLYVYF